MSALTEAAAATADTRQSRCSVCIAFGRLDPESAADFTAWLSGDDVPGIKSDKDMHRTLQALKQRVSWQQIGTHRRNLDGSHVGFRA